MERRQAHESKKKADVLVIVPAYNEAAGIRGTIVSIRRLAPYADIVVVNDGSADDTGCQAEMEGVPVLNLGCNLGIGGAVQSGYRYAEENGYAYAAQIDGDGQHNPADLAALLQAMRERGADMVVGSRFIERRGFQSTFARKLGITLLARLASALTGQRITDPTSGYRLCGRRAIALFAREYPVDYPEVEALVLLDNHRGSFIEVPVVMSERQGGVSSISAMKSAYYMAKVILAVLMTKTKKKRDWSIGYGN